MFTTQKPLPSKIPLTIKTATLNYFWTHFLIKVPSVKLLLKSMHPLHEINHSSACKKSKCMNSSWVFPFLNFIFLWEWNKQKIINKTRHEIHTHFFIRMSFTKIYWAEICKKCKNIAQAQFFAARKHFVSVFVNFHSYVIYSCCRNLYQLVQQ